MESHGEGKPSRRVRSSRWGSAPSRNWRQAPHLTGDYLQDYINRHDKQFFQIGTLLKVNRSDALERDFQLLLESDIGVVIVEDDRLEDARSVIAELKGEGP